MVNPKEVRSCWKPPIRRGSSTTNRLDVYTAAVALDGVMVALARAAPRGHARLGDQAQRASASTVLNLAEALGCDGADRARKLRISKGFALELDAALTLLSHRGG